MEILVDFASQCIAERVRTGNGGMLTEDFSEFLSVVTAANRRKFGMLFMREMARLRVEVANELRRGVVADDSGSSLRQMQGSVLDELDDFD